MSENLLEIRFVGNKIAAEHIRSRDLANVLEAIDDMFASVITSQYPHLTKKDIVIGLVNIDRGSVSLQFCPQLREPAQEAFEIIASAINEDFYDRLRNPTIDALQKLVNFSHANNCNTEFRINKNQPKPLAKITPETNIKPSPKLSGETILYGKLLRVGGKTPKIWLELPDGNDFFCETNEPLAIDLAARLYTWVGLKGDARWNSRDHTIDSFYAREITLYQNQNITETFNAIRKYIGNWISEIHDVDEYVNELRHSE